MRRGGDGSVITRESRVRKLDTAQRRLDPHRIPAKWRGYFEEGGCLEGLPFVWLNRMRATYATLMQWAGVDSTVINAMQGRAQGSQVLYGSYLSPLGDTFREAAEEFGRRVGGA